MTYVTGKDYQLYYPSGNDSSLFCRIITEVQNLIRPTKIAGETKTKGKSNHKNSLSNTPYRDQSPPKPSFSGTVFSLDDEIVTIDVTKRKEGPEQDEI